MVPKIVRNWKGAFGEITYSNLISFFFSFLPEAAVVKSQICNNMIASPNITAKPVCFFIISLLNIREPHKCYGSKKSYKAIKHMERKKEQFGPK